MTGGLPSRDLLEILGLDQWPLGLVSCLAWLLDPRGEHGLGDKVLRSLAGALAREAEHPGPLADREGVAAAARALAQGTPRGEVRLGAAGPAVRLTAGAVTLRLVPCLAAPVPDAAAVVEARARGVVLVALVPGPPPADALGRPASAVWPLIELVTALRGFDAVDAWGHFLVHLRDHLEARLEGAAAPAPAPPAAPPLPGAPPPAAPLPPPPLLAAPAAPSPRGATGAFARPAAPPPRGATGTFARPGPPPPPARPGPPSPAQPPAAPATASGDWVADMLAQEALAGPAPTPAPRPAGPPTRRVSRPAPAPEPAPAPAPAPAAPSPAAHADLDLADQVEGARAVREVLAALQKAIHTFRLYPQEHPYCAESIEGMVGALQRFLERHGALELEIQRDGVAFRGARLVDEAGRASDLSFLLYPEGIRSLSFEHGVTARELHDLVETLSGQDPTLIADQDLLGALWRRELAHVTYLTHDQLSPAALRGKLDATLAPVAARILALTPVFHRSSAESEAALEALLRAEPKLPRDHPALLATRAERAQELRATPAGQPRQALLDQLTDPFQGDVLGRAVDVVAWATSDEDEEPDPADVGQFLAGAVINVLWLGDLGRAADLLGRAEAAGALGPDLLQRLSGRDGLALFVRALRPRPDSPAPGEAARQAALAYLARLAQGGLAPLASLWGRLADEDVRRILGEFLAAHVDTNPEALVPLTEHGEARVAGEALEMLARRAAQPRPRAVLERLAGDASRPERQRRAQEALDALSGEGERRRLLETVEQGQDRAGRVAAAQRLAELGGAGVFERLCALVERRDFVSREQDEVDAVLGALTTLGGVRAVRVLQELAERRTLLGRKETQRISASANTWLAELRKRGRKGP